MNIVIELGFGEDVPPGFAQFIARSGEAYERRYHVTVPPCKLVLVRDGKRYELVGGFWMSS